MKSSWLILSLLALVSSASTISVEEVYGALRVDSTAAETIVAVPWLGDSGDVAVSNIVKTANLNQGDLLLAYLNGGYSAWVVVSNETTAVKTWTPAVNVTEGKVQYSSGADGTTLARGNAIILRRTPPIASCFYLNGRVATNAPAAFTISSGGTTAKPIYTLIAPPCVEDVDVNSAITWSGTINKNDRIVLSDNRQLQWNSTQSKWVYKQRSSDGSVKTVTENLKITAGTGAWYISKGGSPTLTWTNYPVAK